MNDPQPTNLARRHFLRDCGVGLGKMALAGLLTDAFTASGRAAVESISALAPKKPHFPGKAKRVIHLFMAARRRISICSTTSPNSRSSRASRCRHRSSAINATPSSARTRR